MHDINIENTIAAVSTPAGTGGIAVIRVSGPEALDIVDKCWKGKSLKDTKGNTVRLGEFIHDDGTMIDQVLATVFRSPASFTGDDTVEISCHGSTWIQREIINRLIEAGATPAPPGGFTQRAFLNKKLDLAQAEGVIDLINAQSRASARLAQMQLKGNFSKHLSELRDKLLNLGALLELELDFSEEDVEFANRDELINLTNQLLETVQRLTSSYKAGVAFKNGFPVTISGIPNAGKSTLINNLLGEEKAIVSDIPGTTRDIIEDTIEISGILFRFFDTAGIRDTDDSIERIGVERARTKISTSGILLWLIDPTSPLSPQLSDKSLNEAIENNIPTIILITKKDIIDEEKIVLIHQTIKDLYKNKIQSISISARTGTGIKELTGMLTELATADFNPDSELIVTNARHYASLKQAEENLRQLLTGLSTGLSADLLAQDLRAVIAPLGEITGAITTPDLLTTIFSRFCIGK